MSSILLPCLGGLHCAYYGATVAKNCHQTHRFLARSKVVAYTTLKAARSTEYKLCLAADKAAVC